LKLQLKRESTRAAGVHRIVFRSLARIGVIPWSVEPGPTRFIPNRRKLYNLL
jgi:hypothetical protein